jgi:aminoglycoside phosphotransferase (APT) family kinase protein
MAAAPRTDQELTAALRASLAGIGWTRSLRDIRRRENIYESSHHSQVIECSFDGDGQRTLLCKRGQSYDRDAWGLTRGLAYEADVYRRVLAGASGTPRFYGSWEDAGRGVTWMFLEYLGDGWQLDLGPETAIVDAAAVLGELHRRCAQPALAHAESVLNRYDARYLRACLQFGRVLAERWRSRVPAFPELMARLEGEVELLARAPTTLVHGECTPHNFVWAGERPYLVDWEEAALGAGEIDIACLTDEWDEELVAAAVAAYHASRWPEGPPHDFARTLEAARVYWPLRWLANAEGEADETEIEWVQERVQAALAAARRP